MQVRFSGITIYQGQPDQVLARFDAQTFDGPNPERSLGAFYEDGRKAIVLDLEDYDAFVQTTGKDPHGQPGSEHHKGYHYYHPVQFSYLAQDVTDYVDAHAQSDAAGQPIQTITV